MSYNPNNQPGPQIFHNQMNAIDQAKLQAAYNSSVGNQAGLLGQFNSIYSQSQLDIPRLSDKEIESFLTKLTAEYDKRMLDTPLKSPTRRMLNEHPALKNAWDEFNVVWTLIGDKKSV